MPRASCNMAKARALSVVVLAVTCTKLAAAADGSAFLNRSGVDVTLHGEHLSWFVVRGASIGASEASYTSYASVRSEPTPRQETTHNTR